MMQMAIDGDVIRNTMGAGGVSKLDMATFF
jgi:hypothetical protein